MEMRRGNRDEEERKAILVKFLISVLHTKP